ncbi:efflux RND transporter periplasmic adaptor subunit [Roseiarcus sp.]|uniref:efflux RND transporter periplasmic adaptor subunit n=1 Tax=Roseiarcus sp. TaxID=1969460 RepID=UPI003F9EB38F
MTEEHSAGPAHEPPPTHRPVRAGRAILLLIVVAIAVAATGVVGRRKDDESLAKWTQEQAIPTVALVSPQSGGEVRDLVLPGNVEAFYTAAIHAQVSGYVQEWRKDIGAKVRKGDVLAVIETPELDQSIAVAESQVAKAKANLALAKVTAERWNSLRASAAVSQQTVDEKTADARAQAAEVDAVQANLDRLKAQKAFANIVAPFDGIVTVRNVDVGSLVRADAASGAELFAVADVHAMRVYVPVPETYAAEMKDGMKATLDLPEYPDRKFDAKIETTSHGIDQKSRTLLVELLADNKDGALFPGAFARVHFQIPPDANIVRVPASALIYRDNAIQVGVVDPKNRVTLKKVQIARDLGTEVEITSGLSEDERIVANPSDAIGDGEEVRIMNAETEKPDSSPGQQRAKAKPTGDSGEMAASERGRGE